MGAAGVGVGATVVVVGRGPFVFLGEYEKVELCKEVLFKLQKPKPLLDDDCALLEVVLLIALIGVVLVMGIILSFLVLLLQ